MNWVDDFCTRLASVDLKNVFNPYSSCCPTFDHENAPLIRRRNLALILSYHQSVSPASIWFGRDLGHRGGRRTGLALTDEATMISGYGRVTGGTIRKATIGPILSERTASVIWELISQLDKVPVLWNAFPLHPHREGQPFSNRVHTAKEREATAWTIRQLCNQFPQAQLIAIGNDASNALNALGLDHQTCRHPSYGGQRDFVDKMRSLHGLIAPTKEPLQSSLFG